MTTKISSDNIQSSTLNTLGGPKIQTITYPSDDTAADPAGGQTITLTGSGFDVGASVIINTVAVGVVSVVSSTTITFTSPALSAGSYPIYVVNTNGGTAIAVPGIQYSGTPTWSTAAGSIGSVYEAAAISNTFVATGDAPITYSLFSGTLPPTSTLNSANGLLSGTANATASPTTYTFTIRATDAQLQDTNRQFSLTINPDVVTWSSPADNSTVTVNQNAAISNVTLSATSAAGYGITYTANTLPTGLSISGANVTGTPTVVANTTTLLTATASTTNRSATRTINWVVQLGSDPYFNLTTLLLSGETSNSYWIQDASTNKLALTVFGDARPVAFSPYETVWSNQFDGTGDYLDISNNAAFQFGAGDFTVEFWLNTTDTAFNIIGLITASSGNWMAVIASSTFYWQNAYAVNNLMSTPCTAILDGLWHHVAITRTGTSFRVFFDGVQQGSSPYTDTTNYNGTGTLRIGSGANGDFQGYVSNLRILKGTALYTSNFTPPTSPLTAISGTSLLTCQSSRLIDNSTNNFTLTRNGDVSVSNFGPFAETDVTTGSGYFDGTGDWLTIPSTMPPPGSGNFTLECFVYVPTASRGNDTALFESRSVDLSASGFTFGIRTTNTVQVFSSSRLIETSAILANVWHHLALVRSGSTLTIYINGVSAGTATTSQNFSDTNFVIASGIWASSSFPGYISNFRLVVGTAVYTTTFTPPTSPLTAISGTSILTLQNRFGENNNRFVDTSGMNSIVTKFANATQGTFSPFSQTGWSGYFTGSATSFISTPSTTILNQGQTYTVQCWIYPTVFQASSSAVRRMYIFVKGVIYAGLSIHSDGTLGWYGWPTPGGIIVNSAAGTITTNVWQHVALVVNPGNYIKLFKNGVEVGSSSYTAAGADGSAIQIGNGDTGSSSTDGFIGYISNFKITQTALTAGQLDYSASPVISSPAGAALLILQTNRFNDTSANNLAITVPAAPSIQAFSPFSSAIITPTSYSGYFDGTGDYLSTAPSGSTLNFGTGDFCVEAWVYSTQTDSTQLKTITGNYVTNSSGHWQLLFNSIAVSGDRKVGVYIGSPQGWLITSTSTLSFNTWNHIAFTRSGTTVRLFINGTLDATVTSSATIGLDSSAYQIGAVPDTVASFPTRFWMGYISNVRYVKGSAVYTSTFTPSTTPLTAIANTSLLTCQSNRFIDNSTNNFTITANGDTRPTQFNPFGNTSLTGDSAGYSLTNVGGSMYFDGNGDYLAVANNSDAFNCGTSNFTIEFWYYDDGNSLLYPNIISSTDWNTGTGGVGIRYNNTGQANKFSFFWFGVGDPWLTTPGTFPGKVWNHVAVVRSGNTFTLYVNGVSQASNTNSGTINWGLTSGGPKIGGGNWDGGNSWTKGWISNLRLIKGVALYTSAFVPSATPLTAISNTTLLLNGTNSGLIDYTSKNNLETFGNAQLSTAVTKFGNASISFDGTGDYLVLTPSPNFAFRTGPFTIEGWVRINANGDRGVFQQGASSFPAGTGNSVALGYNNSGTWQIYAKNTNTNSSATYSTNTWYHFALVRSSTTTTLYIDGISVITVTGDTTDYTGTFFGVGSIFGTSGTNLNGYIDDLRVTTGYARYTSNFTPPTSAFITF